MDQTFLTISEATKKTGRSLSTVRRLIHTIAEDPKHPDRGAIEPTVAAVEAFKKKGENFTWRIREDVLMKHFPGALGDQKKSASEPTSEILSILQKELDLKNQQIEKQWEVIASLNERLREGNILMGALQKRLELAAPKSPAEPVVDASPISASPKKTVKAKKASTKDSTATATITEVIPEIDVKKPTKSWLLRWMKK